MKFFGEIVADEDIVTKKYVDDKVAAASMTAGRGVAIESGKISVTNALSGGTTTSGRPAVYFVTEGSQAEEFAWIMYEDMAYAKRALFMITTLPTTEYGAGYTVPCSCYTDTSQATGVRTLCGVLNGDLIRWDITADESQPPALTWTKTVTPIGTPAIQTQGNWNYKIYADGNFEAWYKQTGFNTTITNTSGNLYRSNLLTLALPSNITTAYTANIQHADINCAHNNYPTWGMLASLSGTGVNYYAMSGGSRGASPNYTLTAYVFGALTAK